jgi:purine-binding chemotaxis protein CheW
MSIIDWGTVWESVEWGDAEQHENADSILSSRAERYARPPEVAAQEDQDTLRTLVFLQGQERYAIPVSYVVRGVAEPHVTLLPCVPRYYRGVINLRGRILSVLDLQRFWGLPGTSAVDKAQLIVIQAGVLEVALLADTVLEMARMPIEDIVPPVTAGIGLPHVQGVSPDGVVIVDVESLATDERLIIHEEL